MSIDDKLTELQETLDMFEDPASRADLLIGFADRFREVPPEVATRPFSKSHQVPQCESDAYVWAMLRPDRTLALHFAVENPSGISAKALAAILDQVCSGQPVEEVLTIDPGIVEQVFRQNISMGKGMGLKSMVLAVQALAREALK
ncbi:MAG: SufE family protein [Acidobacteria bacterium]|nr:SufE family protein [Acidobacteriota bacterium]